MLNYTDLSGKLNPDCYTVGRDGDLILALVCHSTCGPNDHNEDTANAQALSDAAANYLASNTRQVSVQWLVGAEGCGAPIYRIVPESSTAYHAGGSPPDYPSTWVDPTTGQTYHGYALNQVTIGIEVFGQVSDQLGPNQLANLKALVKDIVSRYPILKDPDRIVAHASLEGDRQDGKNWVDLARGWVKEMTQQPTPPPEPDVITLNGFPLGHGFKDYWHANGELKVLGYPITPEQVLTDISPNTVQVFERYMLEYDANEPNPDWKIRGLDLGRRFMQMRSTIGAFQQQAQLLTRQRDDALSNVAARDSAIKEMQGRIDGQKTLLAQKDALIAQLQAQIAQLQQALNDCRNSPPPPVDPGSGNAKNPPATVTWQSPVRVASQQLWRPALVSSPRAGAFAVAGETGSGSPSYRAGAILAAVFNPPDYAVSSPNPAPVDINDGPTSVNLVRLAFNSSQDVLYATWRHVPSDGSSGWCGYFRPLSSTNGQPLAAGRRLGPNFAGCGVDIDQPDIAYSSKANKLYMVGQIQRSTPSLGFAESADGGQTWQNYVELASGRPAGSGDVQPRIAVDAGDNVHVVYFWAGSIYAKSRVNGQWLPAQMIMDSAADGWGYRYLGGVACGYDGYAYAVGDSQASIWLCRFNPTTAKWEQVSKDALKGAANPRYSGVTATPDGRVLVALGYDAGQPTGTGLEVAWFKDHGSTFVSKETVITHDRDSEVVGAAYAPTLGRLAAVVTFKNPRETFLATSAQ